MCPTTVFGVHGAHRGIFPVCPMRSNKSSFMCRLKFTEIAKFGLIRSLSIVAVLPFLDQGCVSELNISDIIYLWSYDALHRKQNRFTVVCRAV